VQDTLNLNTGQKIPTIGFGTWKILLNGNAKRAVAQALEIGYRLIDTARIYGNEKGVGAAVRESAAAREEIFVTTKLWNSDQGYDSAFKAFDDSLARLGLDYIDLYLIHWPATERRHKAWQALQEIYKSGSAKAIGVSNYTRTHLEELLADTEVVPAVNQIEFHPFVFRQQQATLEFCKQHGIVVEAYSPLAQGHKLGHPAIAEIAQKVGKTNAQVVLRWAIQHGTVPIPKTTHKDRMKENLGVFDFELPKTDMHTLDNL